MNFRCLVCLLSILVLSVFAGNKYEDNNNQSGAFEDLNASSKTLDSKKSDYNANDVKNEDYNKSDKNKDVEGEKGKESAESKASSSKIKKMSKEELEKLEALIADALSAEKEALSLLKKGKDGFPTSADIAIGKWNLTGRSEDKIRGQWILVKKHIFQGENDVAFTTSKENVQLATESNIQGSGMVFAFHSMALAHEALEDETKAAKYHNFTKTAIKNIKNKDERKKIEKLLK